ncbi:uncharacterized protein LOC127879321 isoform X2 [Dreissena polymorpha]|uniref:uncharacterized protein LOC127879321 isoform X2 n=1 Tax=Dreissena polymorpha TaxID=45954 RepID=UPI00226562EE|nr:uncharacterized protein LOC127879321 isoform X2 [Dreissena polymorpha]
MYKQFGIICIIVGYTLSVEGDDLTMVLRSEITTKSKERASPIVTNDPGMTRVIDGQVGDPNICNCCVTLLRPAWIELDFGKPYLLHTIKLFGPTKSTNISVINQFKNIVLFVGESATSPMIEVSYSSPNTTDIKFEFYRPRNIQFVRVYGFDGDAHMTICEIKAFHVKGRSIIGKVTLSSPSMIEDVNEACSAAHAFDDKDITSAGDLCSKCSAARGMTPWLEADLGQHYLIAYVNIAGRLNRDVQRAESQYLVMYLSNKSHIDVDNNTPQNEASSSTGLSLTLNPPVVARYMRIVQTLSAPQMIICEVDIFVIEETMTTTIDFSYITDVTTSKKVIETTFMNTHTMSAPSVSHLGPRTQNTMVDTTYEETAKTNIVLNIIVPSLISLLVIISIIVVILVCQRRIKKTKNRKQSNAAQDSTYCTISTPRNEESSYSSLHNQSVGGLQEIIPMTISENQDVGWYETLNSETRVVESYTTLHSAGGREFVVDRFKRKQSTKLKY